MKKLILLVLVSIVFCLSGFTQSTDAQLRAYTNTYIIPNASKSITATQMNTLLIDIIDSKQSLQSLHWTKLGNYIYQSTLTDLVGIGTNSPGATLDVHGKIWQTGTGESTFLGEGAGEHDDYSNNYSVYLGRAAGKYVDGGADNTNASNSIFIGYWTQAPVESVTNEIVIGAYAIGSGSNTATIGDDNVTAVYLNKNGTAQLNASTLGASGLILNSSDSLIDANAVFDADAIIYDSIAVHLDTLQSHNTRINSLGDGTVTSAGFNDGTGFTISGSPITESGSFTFAQDFSEFTDITESTGIKFVVTDPAEKEIAIGDVDLSDFNNDLNFAESYNVTIDLNAIQVAVLGTYKELIAAPGAGKYIRVSNWDVKITVTTQLDVGLQTLTMLYSEEQDEYMGLITNAAIETDSTKRFIQAELKRGGEMFVNTSVGVILSGTTNPASGDATMSFNITYEILDY